VCVCVCVFSKGSLEASWGTMTPLCLRLACCQSVFVMTVGLLLYRLNHCSQLFIYWPNPRQPSWHLTHTHTHSPASSSFTSLHPLLLPDNTSTSTPWKSLYGYFWEEGGGKKDWNKKEDEEEGWQSKWEGQRAFDLWPLCCGWGTRGGSVDTATCGNQ